MAEARRVNSVVNAAAVLRALAAHEDPVQLGALSAEVGLNKSSVYLMLSTLAEEEFVEKTAHGRYRLGMGLFDIGAAALKQHGLGARLAPVLEHLANATGEVASLSILHRASAYIVQRFETDRPLRTSIRVGTPMPLTTSASGRCLLAFISDVDVQAALADAPEGAGDSAMLAQQLERIRNAGYDVQRDEWSPGVSAVAAPVFDGTGRAVAALSVSSPTMRFAPEEWFEVLSADAARLSELLKTTLGSVKDLASSGT